MAKFTKVLKWAAAKGYEVKASTYKEDSYTIKVSDDISFTVENRKSTIYRSIKGLKGNAAGMYLTRNTPQFNHLDLQERTQDDIIAKMEDAIERAEREAVKEEAATKSSKGKKPASKNLQPIITELHKAFDLLNQYFYDNALTPVVIAIQAKGKSNALGWYTPYPSWAEGDEQQQEITITAEHLDRPYMEILQTLHHEMIHHYCHLNNIRETSRQGKYHNGKFKAECEKRGMHFPEGKDSTIGWSAARLLPEAIALIESWPIDKEVFGIARIDYTSGKGKKDKKSNIIKWTCESCGAVMRSSKFLGIKPYCMNDREPDGTEKSPCACYFTPEIPPGFNGKLSWDDEPEDDAEGFEDEAEAEEVSTDTTKGPEGPEADDSDEYDIYKNEEAVVAGKPLERFDYDNVPRRYNPGQCPECPFFKGESCVAHCSRIEYQNKVVDVYERRIIDYDDSYMVKHTCEHYELYKIPKTVLKLDEVKGDN